MFTTFTMKSKTTGEVGYVGVTTQHPETYWASLRSTITRKKCTHIALASWVFSLRSPQDPFGVKDIEITATGSFVSEQKAKAHKDELIRQYGTTTKGNYPQSKKPDTWYIYLLIDTNETSPEYPEGLPFGLFNSHLDPVTIQYKFHKNNLRGYGVKMPILAPRISNGGVKAIRLTGPEKIKPLELIKKIPVLMEKYPTLEFVPYPTITKDITAGPETSQDPDKDKVRRRSVSVLAVQRHLNIHQTYYESTPVEIPSYLIPQPPID